MELFPLCLPELGAGEHTGNILISRIIKLITATSPATEMALIAQHAHTA